MPTWILCYHKVGPESDEGRFLNVSSEMLTKQIRFLKRRNFSFVKAKSLSSFHDHAICLTFDDAYLSVMRYGLEVLLKEQVPATIFANPGLVDTEPTGASVNERPLASWDMLREAQSEGFEIGNHTYHHPDLSKLSFNDQVKQWRQADLALLEQGLEPGSACFPFGRTNAASLQALRESGYSIGLGLGKRPVRSTDNRLNLPRYPIAFRDSPILLWYKLFFRGRSSVLPNRVSNA